MALTFWQFRPTQVPRVHGDVRPACWVKANFITLDYNARGLSLHSVTYSFKLKEDVRRRGMSLRITLDCLSFHRNVSL